jgi:hypothetical protein
LNAPVSGCRLLGGGFGRREEKKAARLISAKQTGATQGWYPLHAFILWQSGMQGNPPNLEIWKILLSYQKVPCQNFSFTQLYSF